MHTVREPSPLTFYRTAPAVPAAHARPARTGDARPEPRAKKPYTRRYGDVSQQVRFGVQLAFLLIAVWVGAQFYLWVRYYETAGATIRVSRPPGVEAWLPIAALMNTKALLLTRQIPEIHAAGMFMLIAFLAMSLVLRKSFCSWVCPVGTISEWLWQTGRSIFGRTFALPRWADIPLRSLKYILFGLFFYVVVTMPVTAIVEFLTSPYGLVADVKMLDFFRRMGQMTAIVLAVLVVLSVFVKNFWCRYLCPYGALAGLLSRVSPFKIRRNEEKCKHCHACSTHCPTMIDVENKAVVKSAECFGCLTCVSRCPSPGALDISLSTGKKVKPVKPWLFPVIAVFLFYLVIGIGILTGKWHSQIPYEEYQRLIPEVQKEYVNR